MDINHFRWIIIHYLLIFITYQQTVLYFNNLLKSIQLFLYIVHCANIMKIKNIQSGSNADYVIPTPNSKCSMLI